MLRHSLALAVNAHFWKQLGRVVSVDGALDGRSQQRLVSSWLCRGTALTSETVGGEKCGRDCGHEVSHDRVADGSVVEHA